MDLKLKKKVMDSCLLPCLAYGCQTWIFDNITRRKLTSCQRGLERSSLNIKLKDRVRHGKIRKQTGVIDVLSFARGLKWRWAGHVARYTDKRWTKTVTMWSGPHGYRSRGRPKARWKDEIESFGTRNWPILAKNRVKWQSLEEAFTRRGVQGNMDSFFSLFDPSEGKQGSKKNKRPEQDNVKKKADAPKGRRRGRRAHGKNETLPEQSSFLCEPELSTDVLVKDGSYIESYIALNKDEDAKVDPDRKPKRRNSGRKNRRKKNKVSPMKETAGNAWTEADATSWNNQAEVRTELKLCNDVGKNVNDLKKSYKSNHRKETDDFEETGYDDSVYNVIEKLEKVGLKDDTYLAGDFNTDELDNELFSSEEMEDSFDDTASERDDSSEEVYGSLPPEPRFGNVEYKLQLVSPCERRFQHLVTQLKWRLRSGGGSAVYVLGVRDCGALRGLRAKALRASLHSLRRMARTLSATLTHITARRVAPHRAVAEVYIRKLADTQQSVELRVAVMGANEAGKSTLIGVLTQGELDNGRGSARLNMFRHLHEVKSGRTSSLSHEILGFDAQGNVVNYGCSELMTAERIGERSAKLVSFLDLAGHAKYQRTTLHGLCGYCPHHAMLVNTLTYLFTLGHRNLPSVPNLEVFSKKKNWQNQLPTRQISATAGITRITEEHLSLLVALDLDFFVVITKCDIAGGSLRQLQQQLGDILAQTNKKPLLITDENLARNCVAPQKLIIDTIENGLDEKPTEKEDDVNLWPVPVFPVSCVRGVGVNSLHAYLLALQPPAHRQHDNETCEFQIDEIFHVGDTSGPVVGGLLARGQLYEGDNLIIGPFETGEFKEITVRTIYRNRARCGCVRAGHCASLGLSANQPMRLRPGMVLLTKPHKYSNGPKPVFGGCPRGKCKMRTEATDIVLNSIHAKENNTKNRKNVRRKNRNLLQDIDNVESSLVKVIDKDPNIYNSDSDVERGVGAKIVDKLEDNVYRSDSDRDKDNIDDSQDCICGDTVLLEDPNDPRGCMYFQASVHVLRHSTAIYPGFQCTVHIGNVRQTAIIEGILSRNSLVRAGGWAALVFRLTRCPEYIQRGRRLLLAAGQGTRFQTSASDATLEQLDSCTLQKFNEKSIFGQFFLINCQYCFRSKALIDVYWVLGERFRKRKPVIE
ncbi:unnamed protein product [Diatraea saccharalis]|uniref:Tr-type G domain-containing protein n=1 Tax=Diatraea saccharalis TaxID=40085 RepID=A0A9N9R6F0_9NEOP|nr:unnamed protein product [Diatraea saccharalis]